MFDIQNHFQCSFTVAGAHSHTHISSPPPEMSSGDRGERDEGEEETFVCVCFKKILIECSKMKRQCASESDCTKVISNLHTHTHTHSSLFTTFGLSSCNCNCANHMIVLILHHHRHCQWQPDVCPKLWRALTFEAINARQGKAKMFSLGMIRLLIIVLGQGCQCQHDSITSTAQHSTTCKLAHYEYGTLTGSCEQSPTIHATHTGHCNARKQ